MSVNRKHILRPRDYLAAEENNALKSGRGNPSIALVFPNTYYLGMSNLGFQTVQALFNADPHTVCERVFLPDESVINQPASKPLRALESGRAVNEFDCVAFSISFETDYLHLLTILDLAEIPFDRNQRGDNDPIILAGGAAITINPEPIADFCDALFVGEAEEAAAEIVQALRDGKSRADKLDRLAKIEGVYLPDRMDFSDVPQTLPSSICPASDIPNPLETRISLAHLRKYKRRVPEDINGFPVESQIYTPYSEFGKLSLIEVQRGCGRGCKFCAEGFIYTPFRQRDFKLIQEQVLRGLKFRDKIGLIGADLLVYPQIVELMEFIHANGGTFSPSSVRVDALTPEIIKLLQISGHRTLAIAPEAGSDALRSGVNKKFNNAGILDVIDQLISADIPNIKMYFMIGLPGETAKDINDLIDLVDEARNVVYTHARAKKRMGSLIMSINPFIPKPRTPYQVGVFEGMSALDDKVTLIKKRLLPKGNIRIYNENSFFAYIQALLSNGTRLTADYLRAVHENQGALKKALRSFYPSTAPRLQEAKS